jgi:hypothetical protein
MITVVNHVRSHKRCKIRSFKMGMDLLEISKIFIFSYKITEESIIPTLFPQFILTCVVSLWDIHYVIFLDVEQSGDRSFSSYIKDKILYFRVKLRIIPILFKMPHQMLIFAKTN